MAKRWENEQKINLDDTNRWDSMLGKAANALPSNHIFTVSEGGFGNTTDVNQRLKLGNYDEERGTFTPQVRVTATGTPVTIPSNGNSFIRINNEVICFFNWQWDSAITISGSPNLLTGFPYQNNLISGYSVIGRIQRVGVTEAMYGVDSFGIVLMPGTNYFMFTVEYGAGTGIKEENGIYAFSNPCIMESGYVRYFVNV